MTPTVAQQVGFAVGPLSRSTAPAMLLSIVEYEGQRHTVAMIARGHDVLRRTNAMRCGRLKLPGSLDAAARYLLLWPRDNAGPTQWVLASDVQVIER